MFFSQQSWGQGVEVPVGTEQCGRTCGPRPGEMSRLGVEPGPMMTLTVAMALGVKLITREMIQEALQMDALNGTGDNWEVPQGMEISICCSELNRQV